MFKKKEDLDLNGKFRSEATCSDLNRTVNSFSTEQQPNLPGCLNVLANTKLALIAPFLFLCAGRGEDDHWCEILARRRVTDPLCHKVLKQSHNRLISGLNDKRRARNSSFSACRWRRSVEGRLRARQSDPPPRSSPWPALRPRPHTRLLRLIKVISASACFPASPDLSVSRHANPAPPFMAETGDR